MLARGLRRSCSRRARLYSAACGSTEPLRVSALRVTILHTFGPIGPARCACQGRDAAGMVCCAQKALAARLCRVLSSLGYRESDLVSPSPQQRRPYHSRPALQGLSRHKPLASLPIYSTVPFRLSFHGSARHGRRTNETGGTHRKPKCRTQHISTNRARNLRSRSAVNPWNV